MSNQGFILHLLHFTTKVTGCDPSIQFKDGIVPLEEDEHERDTSPLTSCELQIDDSHNLPPGHPIIMVLVSPTTSTGGGSAG